MNRLPCSAMALPSPAQPCPEPMPSLPEQAGRKAHTTSEGGHEWPHVVCTFFSGGRGMRGKGTGEAWAGTGEVLGRQFRQTGLQYVHTCVNAEKERFRPLSKP